MNRHGRFALTIGIAVVVGFALTWSFLAYQDPGMVASFATLLQMCGIAIAR